MQNVILIIASVLEHIRQWLATADLTLLAVQLGSALILGTLVYVALSTAARVLARRRNAAINAGAPPNPLLDVTGLMGSRTTQLFMLIAAVAAACLLLPFNSASLTIILRIFFVALIIQAALWASAVFSSWLDRIGTSSAADHRALANAPAIIGTLVRAGLWTIALVLVFDNLGFNVTALVAGLGIGGIAVGLAVQKILADLFSSLAIVLDRPFEYGDFIVSGQQMGTVERIGLKTTRLRSPTGEQLVIANSDLLDSRIQNFKRMNERRVIFQLGVAFGTPPEKLKRMPALIEEAVKHQELARFERCHLTTFADTSLRFETSYLISSPSMTKYMDCHQTVLLEIYRRSAEEGILLAVAIPGGLPPLTMQAAQKVAG